MSLRARFRSALYVSDNAFHPKQTTKEQLFTSSKENSFFIVRKIKKKNAFLWLLWKGTRQFEFPIISDDTRPPHKSKGEGRTTVD